MIIVLFIWYWILFFSSFFFFSPCAVGFCLSSSSAFKRKGGFSFLWARIIIFLVFVPLHPPKSCAYIKACVYSGRCCLCPWVCCVTVTVTFPFFPVSHLCCKMKTSKKKITMFKDFFEDLGFEFIDSLQFCYGLGFSVWPLYSYCWNLSRRLHFSPPLLIVLQNRSFLHTCT